MKKLLTCLVAIALGATAGFSQGLQTIGPEFQVNTFTTSYQSGPSVAMGSDGSFVVVWSSSGQDRNVIGQLFAAGILPGVLIGLSLIIVSTWISWRNGYAATSSFSLGELWVTFRRALLALGTQSSSWGVFYSAFSLPRNPRL